MANVDYHEVAHQYSLLSSHYDDWSKIDWQDNVKQQGQTLDYFLKSRGFDGPCRILDMTCGMGTQVTGLACHGHDVTGLDLSQGQIDRAGKEAKRFHVTGRLKWVVGDALHPPASVEGPFDIIMSFGNSLPLLGSLENIAKALQTAHGLLKPGGMLLLSVLDYTVKRQQKPHVMQYGPVDNGNRKGVWMETAVWEKNGCQYKSDVYFSYVSPDVKVVHYPFPLLYAIMKSELELVLDEHRFLSVRYHPKEEVPAFSCPLFEAYKPT